MFRAAYKGRTLHFDTAGVRGGNELFRDRETGSQWQQSTVEAITGALKGRSLELYPSLLTNWQEWRSQHPDTLVMQPLPGYAARIARMNAIVNRGVLATSPAPGALIHDDRLAPHTPIIGLEIGGTAMAFPIAVLQQQSVVSLTLGGQPVLIVHQPTSDTTTAFSRRSHGRTLRFHGLEDETTHSHWNAYGVCIAGPLKGAQLTPLNLEPEFWFAWSEFHPGTGLYAPSGGTH